MNPSPPKPTNNNIPYHPNDYWDLARSPDDKNPVHSLTALPGHIPTTRVSPSPTPSPLPSPGDNSTAQLTPPLGQQDVSRGRSTGKKYAQELKLRSRSPRFVPFGGERGTSSGPRFGSDSRTDSGSGAAGGAGLGTESAFEPNYSSVGATGNGHGDITSAATTREHQTADPERQDQRQDQHQHRDDDEVVMSSTAYPGQEWRPAALGQWEYF